MKCRIKKHPIVNATKRLTQVDPTRTLSIRRLHTAKINKQFALLKGLIVKWCQEHPLITNSNPNHDELGRFSESPKFASERDAQTAFNEVGDRIAGKDSFLSKQVRILTLDEHRVIQVSIGKDWDDEEGKYTGRFKVRLDFGIRGKESTHSAKEIQPGSIDMMRKLKELVTGYHEAGFKVAFGAADERRRVLYDRTLTKMGLKFEKDSRGEAVYNSNPTGINQYTVGSSVSVKGKSGFKVIHSNPYGDKNFVQVEKGGKSKTVHKSEVSYHDGNGSGSMGSTDRVRASDSISSSKEKVLEAVPHARVGEEPSLKDVHADVGGSIEDLHKHLLDLHDEGKVKLVPVTRHESGLLHSEHTIKQHPDGKGGYLNEFGYVRKLTTNEWVPEQHPRGPDGRFGEGGGEVHGPHISTLRRSLRAALKVKQEFTAKLDKITDVVVVKQIKQGLAFAKGLQSKFTDMLLSRYGRTAQLAILASSQVVGTGAMSQGIVIPASVVWGSIPGVAIAEGVLQASRLMKSAAGEGSRMSAEGHPLFNADLDHEALAREFLRRFMKEWEDYSRTVHGVTGNVTTNDDPPYRWAASSSQEKLAGFQQWLKTQVNTLLVGKSQEALWREYIHQGWKKGVARSFDDLNKAKPQFTPEQQQFYAGSRDQFLRSSFNQPVAREKVELLASRTFDEMENVTDDMANRMSRVLADGMVQGKGPHQVAKDLTGVVDFSRQRAEVVARTELMKSHNEGQLTAMEQLGVQHVGVEVEWLATPDERTCPICADMEGSVFTIDEAHGLLPRHPMCRCCFVPNVEDT